METFDELSMLCSVSSLNVYISGSENTVDRRVMTPCWLEQNASEDSDALSDRVQFVGRSATGRWARE
jgi:hypothetical protein